MRNVKTILDNALEYVAGAILAAVVFAVTWQVLARYIFGIGTPWTEELAMFLMIWLSLLGAAVAYRRKEHLGIDAFVLLLPYRHQQFICAIVDILVTIFSVSVMLTGGFLLVRNAFLTHQTSAAMGIRMGYVYLAVPVSGFFLTINGIDFIRSSITNLGSTNKNLSALDEKKDYQCSAR